MTFEMLCVACRSRSIADSALALPEPSRHETEAPRGADLEAAGPFEPRITTMHSGPESRAMASDDGLASRAGADTALLAADRPRVNSGWTLIPVIAASGFAGLGYEIVWT